jgi:1-deoxy-D-xylulose-5-phosphate reductoisomerase
MKRVALLGATGSIGRQALEIIDAHPELELVAAASGSQPIDGLAPLTQVGGDLTELLERAQPDVVLNAVVGFAGLPATLWALVRGVDLALANKESLVAAGDLATAAACSCPSTASIRLRTSASRDARPRRSTRSS